MIKKMLTIAVFAIGIAATPSLAAGRRGGANSGPSGGTKWCGSGKTLHVCPPQRHKATPAAAARPAAPAAAPKY